MATETRVAWSRRFVAQSLLAVVATAPALARTAVAPAIPPEPAPANSGSGSVRIASERDNRLTTKVYINGTGPYRFLVDTGAERTLIAAEIAARLALPRGARVVVEGITGRQPAVLVRIRSLRMGSLVSSSLEVPVLPRAMMNVDGYLGLDVLDRHRVVLDFRARTLTVTRPQGFFAALWAHNDEAIVRTLGSSGRLRATDCLVNGVRAAAFVDTGAEVSVSNPALYAALLKHDSNRQIVGGPVELTGVTGGTIVGRSLNIDDIRVGDLHLTYTPLVVAPLEVFDVWGLSAQPALLFGMDCLRRFARVTVDYRRKELRFELASAGAVQPLEAELSQPMTG
ncbi:MAG: retroviral-like aspartic protease family protein [Steroidobacteraceae bacterium]